MENNKIKLDSVLLPALVVPFIMNYRVGPGDTPYLLFAMIFASLLGYIVLDILPLSKMRYQLFKKIALWITVILVLGSVFSSAIIVRHKVAPIFKVHDIILQQEAAIRYLIEGKNPYAEDYFGTFLEEWNYSDTEVNPALYHFVMQPFYLLFAVPFYFFGNSVVGYFDGRMPLFLLFAWLLSLGYLIPKKNIDKRLFVILLAFNPAVLSYTLEGRSDIFMYSFMVFGFYLMSRGKTALSGIPLAIAFATKQSAWPLFPLYAAYLWYRTGKEKKINFHHKVQVVTKQMIPFTVTFAVIVVPFLLWDFKAFMESTVLYLTGSLETSYPISGYGFGVLLNQLGFISDLNSYYPFSIWQALFGLPVLVLLFRYIKKNPSVHRMILSYAIFLFIYWYFSRYFNNSHVGFLSMLFITAYFWPEDSNVPLLRATTSK